MTWKTVAKGVFVGCLAMNVLTALAKGIQQQMRLNKELRALNEYMDNQRAFWHEMYKVNGRD